MQRIKSRFDALTEGSEETLNIAVMSDKAYLIQTDLGGARLAMKVAVDSALSMAEKITRQELSEEEKISKARQMMVHTLISALGEGADGAVKVAQIAYCLLRLDAPSDEDFKDTRFALVARSYDNLDIRAVETFQDLKDAVETFRVSQAQTLPPSTTVH